jgi:hypothetical protein
LQFSGGQMLDTAFSAAMLIFRCHAYFPLPGFFSAARLLV